MCDCSRTYQLPCYKSTNGTTTDATDSSDAKMSGSHERSPENVAIYWISLKCSKIELVRFVSGVGRRNLVDCGFCMCVNNADRSEDDRGVFKGAEYHQF